MKNVLTRDEFNDIVDKCQEVFTHENTLTSCEQTHPFITSTLIQAVLDEGYTLMALCVMLMGYQIDIGHKLEEMEKENALKQMFGAMGMNIVVIPTESPFEP